MYSACFSTYYNRLSNSVINFENGINECSYLVKYVSRGGWVIVNSENKNITLLYSLFRTNRNIAEEPRTVIAK